MPRAQLQVTTTELAIDSVCGLAKSSLNHLSDVTTTMFLKGIVAWALCTAQSLARQILHKKTVLSLIRSCITIPQQEKLGICWLSQLIISLILAATEELIIGEESVQQITKPLQMIQLNSKGFCL